MTVRTIVAAVTVIPALFLGAFGSCQPKATDTEATGGRTGAKGGARSGGAVAAGGNPGTGGASEQAGGQSAAGGSAGSALGGSSGSSGTIGNGGSAGTDAAADGRGGAIVGQGGTGGRDANRSDAGNVDGGPVACDDTKSAGRLGVYFYNDGAVTGQAVQLHFDIVNFTAYGSQLSKVTVRYWFTDEDATTANVVEQYYVPIPTKMKFVPANPPRVGADTVLELSFSDSPDAAISWVETRNFNFAFHKSGYSGTYDQSNDYSYDPKLTKTLGANPKITAYINGVLAWGCEPPVQTTPMDASPEPTPADASIGSTDAAPIDTGS